MKTKMILTGHGHYGSGVLSALELISGPKDTVVAIDFEKEDTDLTLQQKFDEQMEAEMAYLVVCDLMGGSPYKEAARRTYENPQIKVVTGANLGGILDTSFKLNTLSLEELVENIMSASRKNLLVFEPVSEEEIHEEGI